jgi:cytochrome c-type biogenesis protein CcmH/NrfF
LKPASDVTPIGWLLDYVGRYGERILRQPRGRAWVWLNAVPIGALAVGLAGVLLFLARSRQAAKARLVPPQAETTGGSW